MQTVYEIRNNGRRMQTTNADVAEDLSKQGARVTSHIVEVKQQTTTDKGVLVLSEDSEWWQSQTTVLAEQDSWIDIESLR